MEVRDRWGNSPLLSAAESGQVKAVRTLIELGADLEGRDENGRTPFIAAVNAGNHRTMAVLVQHGAKVELL